MRKSMKQRVALFLSFAMAFTSVDSSALAAAADTTEVVSEEAQQEAAVEEEAAVQQEEAAVEEAVVQQEEAVVLQEDVAVEEAQQEDAAVEEEVQQDDAAVEEVQQDEVVSDDVVQEEEAAPVEETPAAEEELTVDEQPSEDQAAEETGEVQQEESASAEDTLTEETESVEEEDTEEAEDNQNAITEENGGIEEQIIGEELYDLEGESVAVADAMETVTVSGITDIVLPDNTQSIVDLDNYIMGYGTQYTIEYSDGTPEDATINAEDENYEGHEGKYGNYIEYYFKRQGDNSKLYSYGEVVPAGRYALVFYADGKEICSTEYVFTNVEAEDAELPELRVGSNEIVTTESSMWTWYQFTATEGIKYHVDRCSGFQVCTRINGNIQNVPSDGDSFKATQKGVYYLGFGPGVWDNEIEDDIYTWTANISVVKEIQDITVTSPQGTRQISVLEQYSYLGTGTKYTITYSDGDTDALPEIGNDGYTDQYGTYIDYRFYRKNDEDETSYYSYYADKPVGDYKLVFFVNGQEIPATEDYEYSVVEAKDANLPKLTVGDQKIQSAADHAVWYQFEADANTKYRIDRFNSLQIYTRIKNEMTEVNVSNGTFRATQAGSYYLGFQYGVWNEDEEVEYAWTANISAITPIESITVNSLQNTQVVYGLENELGAGTTYTIGYAGGDSQGAVIDDSGFYDSYDNYIEYRFRPKDSDSLYYYGGNKPTGAYDLVFYVDGEEIQSTESYPFEIVDVGNANLPQLTEGTQEIQSGRYSYNWYRFTPEESGKYLIDKYSEIKIAEKTEEGWKTVSYGGNFRATAGKTYYIGFKGEIYDEADALYKWNVTISKGVEIKKITVDTPKGTTAVKEFSSTIGYGTEYTVWYSDTTQVTREIARASYTDDFDNYIEYRFRKESEEGEEYGFNQTKPTGSYALEFYVDGEKLTDTDEKYEYRIIDLKDAEFENLQLGKNTITSGKYDHNWYRFEVPETGKYQIKEYPKYPVRVVYFKDGNKEGTYDSYTGVFQAEKGEICYLGFYGDMEEEYTWTTELIQLPEVAQIQAKPNRISFYKGQCPVSLDSLTFTYKDGTEKKITDINLGLEWENDWITVSDIDGWGNAVKIFLTVEGDENTKLNPNSRNLEPGNYTVHIQAWSDATVEASYSVTVKAEPTLEESKADATTLELGRNYTVSVDEEKTARWFSYTPDRDITTTFWSDGEYGSYGELYDADGNRLSSNNEEGLNGGFAIRYAMEKDQTYYFKTRGYRLGEKATFKVAFREYAGIKAVKKVTPDKEYYVADLDQDIAAGSQIELEYTNGDTSTFSLEADNYSRWDEHGYWITYNLIKEDQTEHKVYYNEYYPEGTYKLAVYENDEKAAESGLVYEVVNLSSDKITDLSAGRVSLTSGGWYRRYNWYRLTIPKGEGGRYQFEEYPDMEVRQLVENKDAESGYELNEVAVYNGGFKAWEGQTYYIGFGDKVYDNSGTSWQTTLKKERSVTAVKVTPKQEVFYEDIRQEHAQFTLQFTYDDGTTATFKDWSSSNIDGNGNGISLSLRDRDDCDYKRDEALAEGTYTVSVRMRDDADICDSYNITVKAHPSPFDEENKAEVIPVTLDKKYSARLSQDRPVQWFSYTPDRDISVLPQTTGDYYSRVKYYDSTGKTMRPDKNTGMFSSDSLTLKEGNCYYFKTYFTEIEKPGSISFSLRSAQEIQSLEVVSHDLRAEYLLEGNERISPEVQLRATYGDSSAETFFIDDRDSYGHIFSGEIVDSTGKVVDECTSAGTYTYRVRCGEAAVDVGTFEVKTVKELAAQNVTEANQLIKADAGIVCWTFTVEEAGVYRLDTNVWVSDLVIYDEKQKAVSDEDDQLFVLDKGTYYAAGRVESRIHNLRVTVERLTYTTYPKKIELLYDEAGIVGGIDELGDRITVRVEYTDGKVEYVDANESDHLGIAYECEVKSVDGQVYESRFDRIQAGTYQVTVQTRFYDNSEESQELQEVLKNITVEPLTIEIPELNLSELPSVKADEKVDVSGSARRYFYVFTPEEDGWYKFRYEQEYESDNLFYAVNTENHQLKYNFDRVHAKAGDMYVVVARRYTDYSFRIVKETDESEVTQKTVENFQIQSEQQYVTNHDLFEGLSLLVTYTDGTSEVVDMPYMNNEDGTYFRTREDSYGNEFTLSECPEEYEKEDGRYVRFTVVCGEKKASADVCIREIEKEAVTVTVDAPIQNTTARYIQFTPQESGNYILRVQSENSNYFLTYLDRTWDWLDDSYSYSDENGYTRQRERWLQNGRTYYFEVLNREEDCSYTMSVLKTKAVADLEITGYDEEYVALEGLNGARYTGIEAQITYEDGEKETLSENEMSRTGQVLTVIDDGWVDTVTHRLEARYGDYSAHVDVPAKSWKHAGILQENTVVKGKGKVNVYSFTPSENAVYRIAVQSNGSCNTVIINSMTGKEVTNGWYGYYELYANTAYNIAVYEYEPEKTDFTLAVGKDGKHIHNYVEDRVEPTCVTPGYTQNICSSCGTVEEGSYKELPAAGHKFGDWVTTVKATCTGKGTKQRICSVCGEKEEATVDATDHKYVTDRKESTCTSTGYTQEKCSICGTVKSGSYKAIAKKAHQWKTVVDKKPTCGVAGSQHRECTECGTKEKATAIAATGKHSYGKYVVTKKATLFAKGSKTRTCKVCGHKDTAAIAQIPGTIKLTVSKIPLQVGKTVELSKIVTGLTKGDSVASYTSANTKLAVVTKTGRVTGKAAGNVKVTVKLKSGKTAEVTIAVQKAAVATTSIQNLPKTLNLKLQEKKQLSPVIAPISTTDKLSYASSDAKIVSVTGKGLLTAKKAGKAKVTVKSGKKSFVITVTVTAPAPTGMKNLATAVTLKKGKTLVLNPVLLPAGAQAKITYKSSNTKVAAVDASGKITAKGKGTAQITITAGKVKKTCKVTVK